MSETHVTTVEFPYFDTHFHGRRDPLLKYAIREKAVRVCGGSLEPNTNPHLTSYDGVMRYLEEAHKWVPDRAWRASIYLTASPNHDDVSRLYQKGYITHIKTYPLGGSTHTDEAVSPREALNKNSEAGKLLCQAEECGLPVKRHAEDEKEKDPYKRERADLLDTEKRFMETYPNLRRILAHISTEEAVDHMKQNGDPDRYICELTPHHLTQDRSVLYDGGALLPDHHCLPVIKSKRHRNALMRLLCAMPEYVVAGSDSAMHTTKDKYRFDAFGGLSTYHCDFELYVQILDELGLLRYAYQFLYGNAKRFFGNLVPDHPRKTKLKRVKWTVDSRVCVPELRDSYTPFGYHPDEKKRYEFQWKIAA